MPQKCCSLHISHSYTARQVCCMSTTRVEEALWRSLYLLFHFLPRFIKVNEGWINKRKIWVLWLDRFCFGDIIALIRTDGGCHVILLRWRTGVEHLSMVSAHAGWPSHAQTPGMVVTVIRMTVYGMKRAVCWLTRQSFPSNNSGLGCWWQRSRLPQTGQIEVLRNSMNTNLRTSSA